MEHMELILWLLAYPIFSSVNDYINVKYQILRYGKPKKYSDGVEGAAAVVNLAIYFVVAIYLTR